MPETFDDERSRSGILNVPWSITSTITLRIISFNDDVESLLATIGRSIVDAYAPFA